MYAILLFPFHPLLVEYLKFTNIWRQLITYIFLLVYVSYRLFARLKRIDYKQSLVLFTTAFYLAVQVFGAFFSIINLLNTQIVINAFLLTIGFVPLIIIVATIKHRIQVFLKVSYGLSAFIALGAVYEQLSGRRIVGAAYQSLNNILSADGVYRVGSFFGDALTLGPYLTIYFILGLYFLGISKFNAKYIIIPMQCIIFIAIFLSGVRSAYIMLLVGVLAMYVHRVKFIRKVNALTRQNFVFMILSALTIAPLLFYITNQINALQGFYTVQVSRIFNIFNTEKDIGNVGRVDNYAIVIERSTETVKTVLFGVGYGLSTNYNPNIIKSSIKGFSAENQYLKVIYEGGALGFLGLLSLLALFYFITTLHKDFK
ncbi:O-antigen ligase family protein [Deinococcus sp.]|uniref:O-antigen ligase family protein n=1 Tax=Deinococcus sp. TaxID=47478 RepID=UPI003CC57E0B